MSEGKPPKTLKEAIAARRDALGIPPSDRPANKAEVRQWCLDASPVAIARLVETLLDERVSPDAANRAADTILKYGVASDDEGDNGLQIVVKGGLPD